MTNRGKAFEQKVKEDLKKIPEAVIERLPDQMSGMYGSRNVSDFIFYKYPNLYFIECKTTNENTFPFSNLSQFDELIKRSGKPGVRSGVILWFVKHSKVVYIPVKTIEKMKEDNLKSINIKHVINNHDYRLFEVPSVKKRVFLDSDYESIFSCLLDGD